MSKKKFVSNHPPPRLVRGSHAWYILWYWTNPETFKKERERATFNLNRIRDISARIVRGEELCSKIKIWLERGGSPSSFSESDLPSPAAVDQSLLKPTKSAILFLDALEKIRGLKCSSPREQSNRTWNSHIKLFRDWLIASNYGFIACSDFRGAIAVDYLDFCIVDRKLGSRSYNNTLSKLRAVFKELIKRDYLSVNPLSDFTFKRVGAKTRRGFTPSESVVVSRAVYRRDFKLFLALILQYTCFIRPCEIRRLRFSSIDIKRGVVTIKSSESKTWRSKTVLVPDAYRYIFDNPLFSNAPSTHFVFGEHWKTSAVKSCGEREMARRHRKILEELVEAGEIESIEGLSWYSWKDTGITEALFEIPASWVQDQADHTSIAMTMVYKSRPDVPDGMRHFVGSLGTGSPD